MRSTASPTRISTAIPVEVQVITPHPVPFDALKHISRGIGDIVSHILLWQGSANKPFQQNNLIINMKRTYTGLFIRRVTVESQPLLQNSNQKIKAKTKVQDWGTENQNVEFGLVDELSGTMEVTPVEP